ncbi:MAG TPA: hypothetical protein PLR71_06675 [Deltaproteobacteria bacterium]|nr:hypothetical protein [Deltaproteobacteria bacterium]HQI81233.1 hypothetical protein [Deltaproteobacteria bacterium]
MEQDLQNIVGTYDDIPAEYAAAFTGEHEKKPRDREILSRFYRVCKPEGVRVREQAGSLLLDLTRCG